VCDIVYGLIRPRRDPPVVLRRRSVRLSVCPLATSVYCGKTAEPIESAVWGGELDGSMESCVRYRLGDACT